MSLPENDPDPNADQDPTILDWSLDLGRMKTEVEVRQRLAEAVEIRQRLTGLLGNLHSGHIEGEISALRWVLE